MTGIGRPFGTSATGQREASPRRFNTGVANDDMLRSRDQSGNRVDPKHFHALQELIADVGDPVWACGPTAAALHPYDEFVLAPPFSLLIPRGRHVNRIGHIIHTTTVLDPIDREETLGIPVTAPARTVIDLSRTESSARLTLAIDSGLRDLKFTETHLHTRIATLRSSGRFGIPLLLRVIEGVEVTRGGHSWLERRFFELCDEHALPIPAPQVVLTKAKDKLVRVDFRFPGTPVVVEVLGYRYHRTPSQMQRDAERLNQLILEGYLPLQFTYLHITESPRWVVEQVQTALAKDPFGFCVSAQSRV
ncbi:MAG: hypothetical protein ABIR32_06855 [Ilumatobacteraceae bacterium]